MAQTGIGFTDEEVDAMLIKEAARLSGESPYDLVVRYNTWKGKVSAVVMHKDWRTSIEIKERS